MNEVAHIILYSFFLVVLNIYPHIIRKKFSEKFFNSLAKSCVIISIFILVYSYLGLDLKYLIAAILILFLVNLVFLIIDWKKNYLVFGKIILFTLILIILSINIASDAKIGWDAQNIWFPKALNFVEGKNIYNLSTLPRSDYPYFGSYIWAVFSKISFYKYEYFGRIFYAFLFCLALFSLIEKINLKEEFKFLLLSIILLLLLSKDLFNGYQEVLIFSYAIILSIIAIDLIESKKKLDYLLLICVSFVLFWIKNESFIFTLSFLFILTFYLNCNLKYKIFYILSVFFLILLKYFLFNLFDFNLNLQQGNYNQLELNTIISKFSIERVWEILFYSLVGFVKNPFSFIIVISAIPFLMKFKRKNIVSLFIINFCLSLIIIFIAYALTSFTLTIHLKTSVDRLIFEIMGFGMIIFVYFVNFFIKKN